MTRPAEKREKERRESKKEREKEREFANIQRTLRDRISEY